MDSSNLIAIVPEADPDPVEPTATVADPGKVPETGEDGRVRWGAREINRTRDYVADVQARLKEVWAISEGGTGATTKQTAKNNLGITVSTAKPSGSATEGDIWLQLT